MLCQVIDSITYNPPGPLSEIQRSGLFKMLFPKIKTGDILLLSSKSLIGKIIGHLTFSPNKWSHVAILVKRPDYILRVESTVPRPGIFMFDPNKLPERWAILRYKHIDLALQRRVENIAFSLATTIKYATRGLIGWLTGRRPKPGAMVCSQFVYEVYRRAGVVLVRDRADRVSPQDLWESPELIVVASSHNLQK